MTEQKSDYEFLLAAPKAELHVHLEGTIEPELLFLLAERNGIEIPYRTPEDVLNFQVEKKTSSTENLKNFLECLDISRGVLVKAIDYYDLTMHFLKQCQKEHIVYAEVMFDPQQAMRQGVEFEAAVEAIGQAQKDGLKEFEVETQWIMCFQRDHSPLEAEKILKQAEPFRDLIIGIGLDNAEVSGFPNLFSEVFRQAKLAGYHLTSHCDVNQPDAFDHIRGCIEQLSVHRIDHGLNVAQDEALVDTVLNKNICLTACPTYYATENSCPPDRMKMIKTLFRAGVMVSLNSDDPAQFGSGWLSNTLAVAQRSGGFTRQEMLRFMKNAFQSAWLPENRKKVYLDSLSEFERRVV